MNDPDMTEIWQTVFGKDFGGMAQGNNITGQKYTNTMFVTNHKEIQSTLKAGKIFTYTNLVVDHQPVTSHGIGRIDIPAKMAQLAKS